jgi:hypothetical protein
MYRVGQSKIPDAQTQCPRAFQLIYQEEQGFKIQNKGVVLEKAFQIEVL